MPAVKRTDHIYVLTCEPVDAEGQRCLECSETATGNKLLVFNSVRGARIRQHRGKFCSQDCHDRYYGLKPRG